MSERKRPSTRLQPGQMYLGPLVVAVIVIVIASLALAGINPLEGTS